MMRGVGKLAVVTALVAAGCDDASAPSAAAPKAAAPAAVEAASDNGLQVLQAILSLETASDPKCHSTACRFENFIYGTPLSDEARDRKVAMQKALIGRVWREAGAAAADAGETTLTAERLAPFLAAIAERRDGDDETITVVFPGTGAEPIELSSVRARQFASIAFSLRAILSVQQDAVLNGTALVSLDDEATQSLRSLVDTVTLCALKLADLEARRASLSEVTPALMKDGWAKLVPEQTPPSIVVAGAPASDDAGFEMLMDMIDHKAAAYLAYNDADLSTIRRRFRDNLQVYYAQFRAPTGRALDGLLIVHRDQLTEFTRRLFHDASLRATEAGHRVIRASDAVAAARHLLPRQVDDFEDLHYFHHLGDEDRVTLESYDCDSFRDSRMHWFAIKNVYRDDRYEILLPDPFAAEILAEAVSEYGVLVLRVAGRSADDADDPLLQLGAAHIVAADIEITARAERHHATPAPPKSAGAIVSASSAGSDGMTDVFFTDVTTGAGVAFEHRSTPWLARFRRTAKMPPTFSGGGVAAEDIDGDGRIDLLFVGGGGNAVFRNDGGGFVDVTQQTGIAWKRADGNAGEARQPIIADFDNDGRQDILICYANDDHRIYRNLGEWRFEDVTEGAGFGGAGLICGPATVLDFDGDGLLDVYVTYFGDYVNGALPNVGRDCRNALPNRLFRNLGELRFHDVTEGSGADDTGWAQGVAATDFDRDGRIDLIVANDFGRNALLRNLGDGRFENVAPELGVTFAYHSMNVGLTDLNRDGFPDFYVSNIATMVKDDKYAFPTEDTELHFDADSMATLLLKESNVLYMSGSDGAALTSYEQSDGIGRGETSTGWAWDGEFFDFDNDGDDDLYVVNGANDYYLYWAVLKRGEDYPSRHVERDWRRESNVFFVNDDGRLRNRSGESGADFSANSRSTAYLDWDDDGDLDVAVNDFHGPAVLLRNNAETRGNNWITVQLTGNPARGVSRDAVGARIVATNEEGLHLLREVQAGSGYMSLNPKRQHIGLGAADTVDLEITWPDGRVEIIEGLEARRAYTFTYD